VKLNLSFVRTTFPCHPKPLPRGNDECTPDIAFLSWSQIREFRAWPGARSLSSSIIIKIHPQVLLKYKELNDEALTLQITTDTIKGYADGETYFIEKAIAR